MDEFKIMTKKTKKGDDFCVCVRVRQADQRPSQQLNATFFASLFGGSLPERAVVDHVHTRWRFGGHRTRGAVGTQIRKGVLGVGKMFLPLLFKDARISSVNESKT